MSNTLDQVPGSLEAALEYARSLLNDSERDLPTGVLETIRFFVRKGAWFQISRNHRVLSCRDAARRRNRLGRQGIPLADELRSYLAETQDTDGQRIFVLLHCRGDASIDFKVVALVPALQGLTLTRADVREFDEDEIGYGLINPFVAPIILGARGRIVQVFDPVVLDGSGETGTMMTNAGEKSWAVEFDPRELVNDTVQDFALVASIVPDTYRRHREDTRTIGILTGNAPESGALLWKKTNQIFRKRRGSSFRGDVSYPHVIVHSLPQMGWSMELSNRETRLLPIIEEEVGRMVQSGADLVAFACNTTQFYRPAIDAYLAGSRATFVSLVDPVKQWLDSQPDKTVLVVGIGNVTSTAGWSAFPFLHETPNVKLPDERQSQFIESLAYQVKQSGVDHRTYQKFRSLARSSGADVMLLLLTELSMIFDRFPRQRLGNTEIVDALDLFADKVVSLTLGSDL